MSDKYTTLSVLCLRQSDAAILVTVHEGLPEEDDIWIPKSLVAEDDVADFKDDGKEREIDVKRWFLKKEGISYE